MPRCVCCACLVGVLASPSAVAGQAHVKESTPYPMLGAQAGITPAFTPATSTIDAVRWLRLDALTDDDQEDVLRQKSRWLPGMLVGLAVGTGVGYAVMVTRWYTYGCKEGSDQDALYSKSDCLLRGLLYGGLPGALVGGLIGYQIKTSGWQAAPLLWAGPGPSGVHAGMSVSF